MFLLQSVSLTILQQMSQETRGALGPKTHEKTTALKTQKNALSAYAKCGHPLKVYCHLKKRNIDDPTPSIVERGAFFSRLVAQKRYPSKLHNFLFFRITSEEDVRGTRLGHLYFHFISTDLNHMFHDFSKFSVGVDKSTWCHFFFHRTCKISSVCQHLVVKSAFTQGVSCCASRVVACYRASTAFPRTGPRVPWVSLPGPRADINVLKLLSL